MQSKIYKGQETSEAAKLYSYTIFLDILGYSNRISQIRNSDEAEEIFGILNQIEELIKQYFDMASSQGAYKEYNLHYSFLSDAVVLSFTPKSNVELLQEETIFFNQTTLEFIFTWVMNVQMAVLFEVGLFLRGAISIKEIFWQSEKVVGPALIESYQLEHKVAKYPRIILSPELSEKSELISLVNCINQSGDSAYKRHTLFRKEDNLYYYNFVGRLLARIVYGQGVSDEIVRDIEATTFAYLKRQKDTIKWYLQHDEIHAEKYEWLKREHNFSLKEFASDNNLDLNIFREYLI